MVVVVVVVCNAFFFVKKRANLIREPKKIQHIKFSKSRKDSMPCKYKDDDDGDHRKTESDMAYVRAVNSRCAPHKWPDTDCVTWVSKQFGAEFHEFLYLRNTSVCSFKTCSTTVGYTRFVCKKCDVTAYCCRDCMIYDQHDHEIYCRILSLQRALTERDNLMDSKGVCEVLESLPLSCWQIRGILASTSGICVRASFRCQKLPTARQVNNLFDVLVQLMKRHRASACKCSSAQVIPKSNAIKTFECPCSTRRVRSCGWNELVECVRAVESSQSTDGNVSVYDIDGNVQWKYGLWSLVRIEAEKRWDELSDEKTRTRSLEQAKMS
jgi:hypothetical protein